VKSKGGSGLEPGLEQGQLMGRRQMLLELPHCSAKLLVARCLEDVLDND
jgi:hypothetical protein